MPNKYALHIVNIHQTILVAVASKNNRIDIFTENLKTLNLLPFYRNYKIA